MTKTYKIGYFIFAAAVSTLLMFGYGCTGSDDKSVKVSEKEKPAKPEMTFLDGSNGLPSKGYWRQGFAHFDINGDGYVDILAPPPRKALDEDRFPVVWYGDGKGNWSKAKLELPSDLAYGYGSIAASDFNGDGLTDIALAMHGQGVRVFMRTSAEKPWVLSEGLPPSKEFTSRALVSDDFNNDGVSDIAAVSEARFDAKDINPTGPWIFSRAGKTWNYGPIAKDLGRGMFADQIAAGDVTGDGNRDIAVGSLLTHNHNIVWVGDGKGGFTPFNSGLPADVVYYPAVDLGDINGDGRDDLAAFISGIGADADFGLRAFMSGKDGFEEISEGLPQQTEIFTAISVADLDGDGRAEIIGGTRDGKIKIFSMKGKRWEELRVSGLPETGPGRIYSVYGVDLSGDGYKDIAFCYSTGKNNLGGIKVFLNVPQKNNK